MKALVLFFLVGLSGSIYGQGIIGTWQLTDDQTCLKAQFEKSETEKELEKSMGSTQTGVAKLIRFDKKGSGEEGIFSVGKKKGAGMTSFQYDVKGNELFLKDKKSGIITQRFIIDEVTESTLKIHNALKDCEVKIFSRVK